MSAWNDSALGNRFNFVAVRKPPVFVSIGPKGEVRPVLIRTL